MVITTCVRAGDRPGTPVTGTPTSAARACTHPPTPVAVEAVITPRDSASTTVATASPSTAPATPNNVENNPGKASSGSATS